MNPPDIIIMDAPGDQSDEDVRTTSDSEDDCFEDEDEDDISTEDDDAGSLDDFIVNDDEVEYEDQDDQDDDDQDEDDDDEDQDDDDEDQDDDENDADEDSSYEPPQILNVSTVPVRRSTRNRKPVQYYEPELSGEFEDDDDE